MSEEKEALSMLFFFPSIAARRHHRSNQLCDMSSVSCRHRSTSGKRKRRRIEELRGRFAEEGKKEFQGKLAP